MTQHLLTLIEKFLGSNPNKSAQEIANDLKTTRRKINATLYRHPEIFYSIGSDPPLWSLVPTAINDHPEEESSARDYLRKVGGTPYRQESGSLNSIRRQLRSNKEIDIAELSALIYKLLSLKSEDLSRTSISENHAEVITSAWIKLNIPEKFRTRFKKLLKEHHLSENKTTLGELFQTVTPSGTSEVVRNLNLLILLNGNVSIVDIAKFAVQGRLEDHPDFSLLESRRKDPTIKRLTDDLRIVNFRANGETLESVATKFGLTRERIRQRQNALLIYGIDFTPSQVRIERKSTSDQRKKEVLCQYILKFPGCSIDELQESLQMDRAEINHLLPKKYKKFLAPTRRNSNSSMTKEEILNAIKFASTLEYPLSGPGFDELLKSNSFKCVSRVRILQIFGTWSRACDLAGVESLVPVRMSYDRIWSESDLWEYVMDFVLTNRESFSFGAYDSWARERPGDRPSSGTMRNYLGPWSEVLSTALLRLRENPYHEIFRQNQESVVKED